MLRESVSFLKEVYRDFSRRNTSFAAAAIAYYLTLTMIPLAVLLVSVAAFFVTAPQAEALAAAITASFGPRVGDALYAQVLSIVHYRGILTGIALLAGFWTGGSVFTNFRTALNTVLEEEECRSIWVRYGISFLLLISSGLLLTLALVLIMLVRLFERLIAPFWGRGIGTPWFVTAILSGLIPFLLVTAVFALIYRYLPARRLRWRAIIPGAITAGVLWTVVLYLFSWYASNFRHFQVLYGSLAGVILLMLWFNYGAIVLLLGAEISHLVELRWEEREQSDRSD
jgi:membrane protein